MLDISNEYVREHLTDGKTGLELEVHRITGDGYLVDTKHPFEGNKNIGRDFSEDQIEINTDPMDSPAEAVDELKKHLDTVYQTLSGTGEIIWPFSNPPYIDREEDIKIAEFTGEKRDATEYRKYLSDRYGRYLMTYSGIHYNYSTDDLLIKESYGCGDDELKERKNNYYTALAGNCLNHCWLLVALLAASPVADGSFMGRGKKGETLFNGYASMRCGDEGYWNEFVPILNYSDIGSYAKSINSYVESGQIIAPRELYYPIRLKPRGKYDINKLPDTGVSHIEFRMVDLNPFEETCIDLRDVEFMQLLFAYLGTVPEIRMDEEAQRTALSNIKEAARYDIDKRCIRYKGDNIPIKEAALDKLNEIREFLVKWDVKGIDTVDYQISKLTGKTYAKRVKETYGDSFVEKGLSLSKDRSNV